MTLPRFLLARLIPTLFAATVLFVFVAIPACGADCALSTTVGLDTSYVDTWSNVGPLPGEAVGETFLASSTEILSITLWRTWYDTPEGSIWHIFIMGVDSTGTPDVQDIIQDGPTLWIPYGDGAHPTPFRFVFDPPVQLPRTGTYEFAIQGDACDGNFLIATDSHDDYPDGIVWSHGREVSCDYHPRSHPIPYPNGDLVFQVEFCSSSAPTQPSSWGHIKSLYRE